MTDFVVPTQRRSETFFPDETPNTPTQLLICWDRETGWGHIATEPPRATSPRFVAFHRFCTGDPKTVCAPFVAAGYTVLAQRDLADGLLEVRLAHLDKAAN